MKIHCFLAAELLFSLLFQKESVNLTEYFRFPEIKPPSISVAFLLENADLFDVTVTDIEMNKRKYGIAEYTYSFVADGNTFEIMKLTEPIEEQKNGLYEIEGTRYLGISYNSYLLIIKEIRNIDALLSTINTVNGYLEAAGKNKIRLIFE